MVYNFLNKRIAETIIIISPKSFISRPVTIINETRLPLGDIDNSYEDLNKIPPACGRKGGSDIQSIMIKDLRPEDYLFKVEKNRIPIKDLKFDHYDGPVFELRLFGSDQIHLVLPENLVLCLRKVSKISKQGEWGDIPKSHFQKARKLRSQSTPPEKKLWQFIRAEQLGIKFRSQHPINRYIVDFYARKAGLVIEVDGESSHTYPDQIKYDHDRDKFMEGLGLKVLRFSARDVLFNIEGVISEIDYHLKGKVPDCFPSGQWRYVKNIKRGDGIFFGKDLRLSHVATIQEIKMECDVIIISLQEFDNFITDSLVFHI